MHMHYAYAYAIAKEATNQYVEFFFPVSFVVLPISSFLVQIGLEIYLVALGEPQFRGDLFSRNFKCPARCRCSKTKDFVHISSVFINFYIFYRDLKDPTTRQNFDDTPGQIPKLILTLRHMRICASRCACKNLDTDQPHIEQKRVLQRQIIRTIKIRK